MEVTNAMVLTAITDLSGFVTTLTEDMAEVKSDIAGMKEDVSGMKEEISSIKQEMKQMNEKIDDNSKLVKRIDDKLTILNEDLIETRTDVYQLKRVR